MSLITIDTETKEIRIETERARMLQTFMKDKMTLTNALDRALDLNNYSIVAISPKKANKKRASLKVTIEEITNIVAQKGNEKQNAKLKELLAEKKPIIDKKTNQEKKNKNGETIYQSNYLSIRNWFIKEFPKEVERLKS